MVEEHAGRTVQLGNDDALSAVDDKGAGGRHERNLAHVHLLLFHLLDGFLGCFPVHNHQPHAGAQRAGEGQAALLAFLDIEGRLAEGVIDELQACIAAMAGDREDRGEGGLQALVAALHRRNVRLQERQVGLQLGCQQEWHVQNTRALGEALADALFLGVGVRHIGSGGEKSVFSCQLLAAPRVHLRAAGNWKL
jgi:hypothetical protein